MQCEEKTFILDDKKCFLMQDLLSIHSDSMSKKVTEKRYGRTSS